jgi:hypothetical protein
MVREKTTQMAGERLIPFWIATGSPQWPLGFGITAWSLEDAVQIIRALGYGSYLPGDPSSLHVTEGVTMASLDQQHVIPNMGPIVVRGMWFPFITVGVPRWAQERTASSRT